MGMFRPILIRLRGGRQTMVSSLSEAQAVMQKLGWSLDGSIAEMRALRLISEAIEGRCAPRIAFDAFISAAQRKGIYREVSQSPAWIEFEAKIG